MLHAPGQLRLGRFRMPGGHQVLVHHGRDGDRGAVQRDHRVEVSVVLVDAPQVGLHQLRGGQSRAIKALCTVDTVALSISNVANDSALLVGSGAQAPSGAVGAGGAAALGAGNPKSPGRTGADLAAHGFTGARLQDPSRRPRQRWRARYRPSVRATSIGSRPA